MAMANTSSEPANTPGMLSGKVMLQKVAHQLPPRLRAASSSTGSMLRMIPISDKTMKGRESCTSPTTVPNALYMSGSGCPIRPHWSKLALIRPLSPIKTISPYIRMTRSNCIEMRIRIMYNELRPGFFVFATTYANGYARISVTSTTTIASTIDVIAAL
jgi:hypothetical protein